MLRLILVTSHTHCGLFWSSVVDVAIDFGYQLQTSWIVVVNSWRDLTQETIQEETTVKTEVHEHKSNGLIAKKMPEEEEEVRLKLISDSHWEFSGGGDLPWTATEKFLVLTFTFSFAC